MLNKFMGIGNLTMDPVARTTSTGKELCTFSIAINASKTEVFYIEVCVWEKLAATCSQFLKKGAKVFVEGSLKTSTWTGKDGQKKSKVSCQGAVVKFLSGKSQQPTNNNTKEDLSSFSEAELAELADIPF